MHSLTIHGLVFSGQAKIAQDCVAQDQEQNTATYGQLHGLNWYHNQWRRPNHITSIGEGMAMLDLSGYSRRAHR